MRTLLACAIAILANDASAATFKVTSQIPVTMKIKGAKTIERDGNQVTVVEVDIKNGKTFTRKIALHCEAEMKGGFTWNIKGQALSLSENERRSISLVADADEYSSNPTKLECFVSEYEGSYF